MADYMVSGLDEISFKNICKQGHCIHKIKDNRVTEERKCNECIIKYFERKTKNDRL